MLVLLGKCTRHTHIHCARVPLCSLAHAITNPPHGHARAATRAQVMKDPVIATDGYTYERAAITDWLARKAVSPLTNQKMPGGNALIPNHNLRSSIMEWKQKNGLA